MIALALAAAALAPSTIGVESFSRLDLLPVLRTGFKVGAVTSYDRTGGNDDGFGGTYSFVRKEGNDLVLADLKGPGCITRLHTPTPTDELLEFYLDGEATPRISMPYRQYFTGEKFPFVKPLVDTAGGGCYSYVPIPFAKSCKVLLRAPRTRFYDLNFVQYPAGTAVESYREGSISKAAVDAAALALAGDPGKDLSHFNQPTGSKVTTKKFDTILAPGKAVTIFESKKGGRIATLRVGPDWAFAGKDRGVLLRVTWDGEKTPSILMPVGDFFGYAWGKPEVQSSMFGTYRGVNYCNFPMPFAKSAKIELVSTRDTAVPVQGEVVAGDKALTDGEGRFYAEWRRENPTTAGKPFTWLEASGRGHLVGLSVQSQGMESGLPVFFEGDDVSMVDGELAIHGTGSEDFFNGGWYAIPGRWEHTFSLPLSGCLVYHDYLGRTGGYRLMLTDAVSFDKSLVQTIEHGGENNAVITDYVGVAYYYADRPQSMKRDAPSLAQRLVKDPTRLIYGAHWNMPLGTFGLSGCTMTRGDVKVGDGGVHVISLKASGAFGFADSHFGFRADIPAAGRYKVYVDAVKGPGGGQLRLSNGTVFLGPTVDFYAAANTREKQIYVGEFDAVEGENLLFFQVVGKNEASSGFGLDLEFVICEKAE
jgi:hypothetical protein